MIKQTQLLQNIVICQWRADPLFADCSPLTNHDISLNLVQLLLTISTFALDMQCNIRNQPMLMQSVCITLICHKLKITANPKQQKTLVSI